MSDGDLQALARRRANGTHEDAMAYLRAASRTDPKLADCIEGICPHCGGKAEPFFSADDLFKLDTEESAAAFLKRTDPLSRCCCGDCHEDRDHDETGHCEDCPLLRHRVVRP